MERFSPSESGLSVTIALHDLASLPDAPPINFLPVDMPMICFIMTAFNQLANAPHQREYGKFGIVLTDKFLRDKCIAPVEYYNEASLFADPLVRRWNEIAMTPGALTSERLWLERDILTFRKPAKLFPGLKAITANVTRQDNDISVQYLTYDRYPEGYDFTAEREWRIAFEEVDEYLHFREEDLYMVITPDERSMTTVQDYFNEWQNKPRLRCFPCS